MKIAASISFIVTAFILFGCSSTPPVEPTSEATIAELTAKADAGDPNAQNHLGSLYQAGDGLPKDYSKALAFYQKAAASGLPVAEFNIGFMYDTGLGVGVDQKTGNEWYLKSAEQGYAPAMLNLGMNIAGGEGTPPDLIEGMKWVDLARFFTQNESDMQVKWRIRSAYDNLKQHMTNDQFNEAVKRSAAWSKEYLAKKNGT